MLSLPGLQHFNSLAKIRANALPAASAWQAYAHLLLPSSLSIWTPWGQQGGTFEVRLKEREGTEEQDGAGKRKAVPGERINVSQLQGVETCWDTSEHEEQTARVLQVVFTQLLLHV